ncbi:MAG: DUF5058 family protein [Oscillospiraceae bacterium]|nr:DUF5058 family protein [Oscillospiraceae bacterium]
MSILAQLNSPVMYLICGTIIAFVALVCVFFMIRAYKAGISIGMDPVKMKRTITASATFTLLPSIGILLGVIALSGSLGTPLPWLRLSVIGALHYETQVAEAAAEAVGLSGLNATEMTAEAFTTIALLMSFCIMWGMLMSVFFTKRYLGKIGGSKKSESSESSGGGIGDIAMTAMFIGLVSAYVGSYIGDFVSGSGDWLPIAVAVVAGAVMAVFIYLAEKKNLGWLESFSIAGSMIVGMAAAVLFG